MIGSTHNLVDGCLLRLGFADSVFLFRKAT